MLEMQMKGGALLHHPVLERPRNCAVASTPVRFTRGPFGGHGAATPPLGASSRLAIYSRPQTYHLASHVLAAVSRRTTQQPGDTGGSEDVTYSRSVPRMRVPELLKRLKRANTAMAVMAEYDEWFETATERQQREAAAVVGTAALQVLTRVLGPGAKLHAQQWEEVQGFVRRVVAELHARREALTFEQLSAVASSLVLLQRRLAEGGEGHDGQQAGARLVCSPQQMRDLAAALPALAQDAVSAHPLPAVLAPVCQAYGSMLQLLQLTHTNPDGQHPGTLTLQGAKDIAALYGFLSRTVLSATQLQQVRLADLSDAVQVAVQYCLALPSGLLDVPPAFLEAVRLRVDELVLSARGEAVVGTESNAQRSSSGGGGAEPLDAKPLVKLLRALCRSLAAAKEAERAPGVFGKKAKGHGITEAWLLQTTALLLRSSQAGAQDTWRELNAVAVSVKGQLEDVRRELREAERKRQDLEAKAQQQQQQQQHQKSAVGNTGGKAAAKQEDEQQAGAQLAAAKEAAVAAAAAEDLRLLVMVAEDEVAEAAGELRKLGIAWLQEQVEAGHLVELAKEVAEAAGDVGPGGAGTGAALEGLLQGRLTELRPYQVLQAMSALSLTGHTLSPETLCSVLDALGPQLDRLSRPQQLQLISMLSGPGEQAPKPTTAAFLAALTHAVCSSRGGLGSAPSELLFAVVGTAARWRVPLDQGWLGEVEQELMNRLAAEGGASAAGAREQPALRQQLLSGLIRPLATLGQELRKADLFVYALDEWRGRASKPFPDLDPSTAALLLGWAARGHGWQPTPQLHKAVEALAGAALGLPVATSSDLGRLLLAASRAVEATVDPDGSRFVPVILLPAVKKLLTMKPTANDLASAVAALYGKPRPKPDLALLKRMLDMAQPQMASARPLSYAQLLTGCAAAGWRPDDRWLAEHHTSAAKALRAPCAADADVLLQLLNAMSAPQLAPQAGSISTYLDARDALLLVVTQGLLREPALASLAAQPDVLVGAVRLVAVLGVRPDGQWVQQLVTLTQGLVPQLSSKGLASAAEGLALLRSAPPASFLNALLLQADTYDLVSYDARDLGLLLGGVHRLQAGALSAEAQEVWGRAHHAFLPQCLHVLPSYTPAQAAMVAGSVVAFQLALPAGRVPAVDAPWLSGLLRALQCHIPSALPPPALLLDLLRLGSRVLDGRKDGGTVASGPGDMSTRNSSSSSSSSRGAEGGARELLLSYVEHSLTHLAAAGAETARVQGQAATSYLPPDWRTLVRLAVSAGVRPNTAVLQQYTNAVVKYVGGVVSSSYVAEEDLSAALVALEEAITLVLLPALPWVPTDGLLPGVLADPKLLQACSPRRLALLCTYATQSQLGSQRMWERVGEEVRVRGVDVLLAGGSALDLFAIHYGMEMAGGSVAVGAQPEQRGRGVWLERGLQQMRGLDSSGSSQPSVNPLQALHVLWAAHRMGDLQLVPPGVWAAAHAATDDQLQLLLPYQLAQLVELRTAAGAEGLQRPPSPDGYTARVLRALLQRGNTGARQGVAAGSISSETRQAQGLAAARALAYLPAQELGEDWESLVPHVHTLYDGGERAGAPSCCGGRLTSLSAADVVGWILAVERLHSPHGRGSTASLSLRQLQGVCKALQQPAAVGSTASNRGAGSGGGVTELPLPQVTKVARALLRAAPQTPKALETLAWLLDRLSSADANLSAAASAEELHALASHIISAGGNQALPPAAAAALLRLLSCHDVAAQLSPEQALQAVQYGLAGGQQPHVVVLPEPAAEALVDKLAACNGSEVSRLGASCLVYSCGGSAEVVRRAAAAMLQQGERGSPLRHLGPEQLMCILDALAECGVSEPVLGGMAGTAAAARGGGGGWPEGSDTPLADVALEAVRALAAAAKAGWSFELELERDEQRIAALMRTAVVLEGQLEGLQVRRVNYLEALHGVLDNVEVELGAGGDKFKAYQFREGSAVWGILDAAYSLGGAPPCCTSAAGNPCGSSDTSQCGPRGS